MDVLFTNEYGVFSIEPATGHLKFLPPDFYIEDEEDDSVQVTEGGAEYSIFEDDEMDDALHIEIDPDFIWSKDDIWELIDELLYRIGEIDEDGNLIGEGAEKPLFVIKYPGPITVEMAKIIELNARSILKEANIDAVPMILSDGLNAYFEQTR